MKNTILYLSLSIILVSLGSCRSEKRWDFLEGTWLVDVDGREQFECWERSDEGTLVGQSYEMQDGEKLIFETMEIVEEDDKVYLVPTVPDQNEGLGIKFLLNEDEKEMLVFENHEHDFPNTIRYKEISDSELAVDVLGDNGFQMSLKYKKQ